MSQKKYTSVVSMLKGMGMPQKFIKEVKKETEERSIAHLLSAWRCKAGLTEAQLAKKLRWTVGYLRVIEGMKNDDLRLGDLFKYAQVVGLDLSINIK